MSDLVLQKWGFLLLVLIVSQLWARGQAARKQRISDAQPVFDLVAVELILQPYLQRNGGEPVADQVRSLFRQYNQAGRQSELIPALLSLYDTSATEEQAMLEELFADLGRSQDPLFAQAGHALLQRAVATDSSCPLAADTSQ